MDAPVARALGCPRCGHDHWHLPCDFCSCRADVEVGVYEIPWCEVIAPDESGGAACG